MNRDTEKIKYVMMGEDGFYTFEDTWESLPREIGFMVSQGYTLLGVDGLNGFKVDTKEEGDL